MATATSGWGLFWDVALLYLTQPWSGPSGASTGFGICIFGLKYRGAARVPTNSYTILGQTPSPEVASIVGILSATLVPPHDLYSSYSLPSTLFLHINCRDPSSSHSLAIAKRRAKKCRISCYRKIRGSRKEVAMQHAKSAPTRQCMKSISDACLVYPCPNHDNLKRGRIRQRRRNSVRTALRMRDSILVFLRDWAGCSGDLYGCIWLVEID